MPRFIAGPVMPGRVTLGGDEPFPSGSNRQRHALPPRRCRAAAAPLAAWLLTVAATAAHAQPPAPTRPADGGGTATVVATVDDEPLSQAQLRAAVARTPALANMTPEQRLQLEARGLEQLIWERLIAAEARRQSVLVDPQDVEDRLRRAASAAKASSLEEFVRVTGNDEDQLRRLVAQDIMVERLLLPRLNDSAIRAAFEARRREFDGSRVRVSHIVLRPETALGEKAIVAAVEQAESIRREILRGDIGFADAARRYSAGPSRQRGGDIGFVGRQEPMTEEFSQAVFTLPKGEISKPIVTSFGIHVATVTEIEAGRTSFEAVRAAVYQQVATAALKDLMTRLRGAVRIAYFPGVPHFAKGQSGGEVVVLDAIEVVEPDTAGANAAETAGGATAK